MEGGTVSGLTPEAFAARWAKSTLSERASAQAHFIDLCRMLGEPTPTEADPTGEFYAFERGVEKTGGGKGFADVWYEGHFAFEYKGKHKDLKAAYDQLLRYREDLGNPPLLVVCDIDRFEVHTNFTNTVKKVYAFANAELPEPENLRVLRALFQNPDALAPAATSEHVTLEAAKGFATLADGLRERGVEPERAAHFLNKLLFCLFAEDVGLLPKGLFSEILKASSANPEWFVEYTRDLFSKMAVGGHTMLKKIRHFNGGLFADADTLPLSPSELATLAEVSKLDWGSVEPAIFGTFFERSLDPRLRAKLGAHYTSREDILALIEPVLMAPLREEWARVQQEALAQAAKADGQTERKAHNSRERAVRTLQAFAERLRRVRVLDPACGSGNFLYMSLKELLDLEKEVSAFSARLGMTPFFPEVSPDQLFGMELSPYAHELAQVVVWIGYLQWKADNGYGDQTEPILGQMENIKEMDAILSHDAEGVPVEPEWPQADFVVGNPPFLGGKRMRAELEDAYVDDLFALYEGRVPREADLVTYWFERTRSLIESGRLKRAGLIATNSIRGGKNREVLKRINASPGGGIFFAESDRPWVQNGAAVRVSMVGFGDGSQKEGYTLDGLPVGAINSDLTGSLDLTSARRLAENRSLAFMADTKGGPFDISPQIASRMLSTSFAGNPNGRPNSDVVRPWANGMDITRRPRGMYIIDFGTDMSLEDAALYEAPFEYVQEHVRPMRATNNRKVYRERWWLHMEPRPAMRRALGGLGRYIATSSVSKHRLFTWLDSSTLPDHALIVFAREDDYFFGVLQSGAHVLWALRMGTFLGVGNDPRYTPTTCFETFPLPWPPGKEPSDDPLVEEIAAAAKQLDSYRENYLHPEGLSEAQMKKKTLTNLYNENPTWLANAHERLDRAVYAAYGWEEGISEDDVLANLMALNLERSEDAAGNLEDE